MGSCTTNPWFSTSRFGPGTGGRRSSRPCAVRSSHRSRRPRTSRNGTPPGSHSSSRPFAGGRDRARRHRTYVALRELGAALPRRGRQRGGAPWARRAFVAAAPAPVGPTGRTGRHRRPSRGHRSLRPPFGQPVRGVRVTVVIGRMHRSTPATSRSSTPQPRRSAPRSPEHSVPMDSTLDAGPGPIVDGAPQWTVPARELRTSRS